MRIKIDNRIWTLHFVNASELESPQNYGECDLPTAKKPAMNVRKSLLPKAMLNVTIHELLHAMFPAWTERKVKKNADLIASVLYSLGARITPPN